MRRIRKCWLDGAEVAVIGAKADLTYPYSYYGEVCCCHTLPMLLLFGM